MQTASLTLAHMQLPGVALTLAGMLAVAVTPASARAQQPGTTDAPGLPRADEEDEDRVGQLEQEVDELRRQLREARDTEVKRISPLSINGYVDFGFFVPNGNHGVGWVRDDANRQFPEYAPYSWTFLGDIFATAVNSRGEVADLGDAPGIDRFDSIDSDGALGFLVNELNLRVGYALADRAILRTSANFAPRSARQDFSLGDSFDVDLAELEYLLTEDGGTSLIVGKTLPVFGIEYKERKSDQRFGITPSLLARYTTGSQLGIKLRSKLLRDWLILAGSVTNNSSTTEPFHFYSEIDKNDGKTLNGRLAISVPMGDLIPALAGDRLEIGASGEWGPQDRARDNKDQIWFAGVDLQYLGANYALKAQGMRGEAPGSADQLVWGLELRNSGYVEVAWQFLPWVGILLRGEARDALVTLERQLVQDPTNPNPDANVVKERAYLTKSMRFTGGLRAVFNAHMVLKAEYLHNREYGGIAQFDNDIFTSSLVMAF